MTEPYLAQNGYVGNEHRKPNPIIINGVFQIIHQHFNSNLHIWEEFDPVVVTDNVQDGVIFVVYYRHESRGEEVQVKKVVEVRSEILRKLLKGCLKSFAEFVDPVPMSIPPNPMTFTLMQVPVTPHHNSKVHDPLFVAYFRSMRRNYWFTRTC